MEKDVAMQLKETYQKISQIMQAKIDKYDLTFGLLLIINFIDKYPDASQKDIAKKMKFTQGAMSIAVKKLLELGIAKQTPLKSDMRHNRLALTEKGKSVIADYKDYLSQIHRDMFNGFEHGELIELYDLLLRINVNLDNIRHHNLIE